MKERPILFSTPMVRALMAGHKTQTRRVVQPQDLNNPAIRVGDLRRSPYGGAGDRLWVRELWRVSKKYDEYPPRSLPHERGVTVMFQAGGSRAHDGSGAYVNDPVYPIEKPAWAGKLRAPIYLPRWASRLTIEVTSVHIERLQEISEEDAQAEGPSQHRHWPKEFYSSWRTAYRALWDEINGKKQTRNWDANPWVWVVEFKVVNG